MADPMSDTRQRDDPSLALFCEHTMLGRLVDGLRAMFERGVGCGSGQGQDPAQVSTSFLRAYFCAVVTLGTAKALRAIRVGEIVSDNFWPAQRCTRSARRP